MNNTCSNYMRRLLENHKIVTEFSFFILNLKVSHILYSFVQALDNAINTGKVSGNLKE